MPVPPPNDDRARILFLVSTLRRSGPTVQLLNIVRHLDRTAFEPVIVTLSAEPESSMIGSFEGLGATVRSLSLSRARGMLQRAWRDKLARLAGVDLTGRSVIHSQGIRADVISSTELEGLVRVATAHNYPYDDYPMKFGPVLGRWMAWRHLKALREIPVVVACSSSLANKLRDHGLDAAVIRNAVDTSRFRQPQSAERARLRQELNLAHDVRLGVCVGSVIPRKDPLTIVRAIREIQDPGLAMVFVGGGTLERQARNEAGGDARIRFTGHIDDVLPYLHAADFFVSASSSEGLPSAVLEAIACGLPVMLSEIEPHKEILGLAPTAGQLFALHDRVALRATIQRMISPATAPCGLRPGEAAELLGAESLARHYQELYLRLLRLGPRVRAKT